ncbi:unnamed protein product [Urochloa decumbens]|uniref:Uncharacterized protein n=1 Tax=Urochloa decumbens TaxID=240449 RepID=A0ABC8ZJ72_9POAL
MDATATGDDQNGVGRDGREETNDAAAAAKKKVSLLSMFRYADRLDVLLMVAGAVGAVANGMTAPLMTVLFGNVIDSFGVSTTQNIIHKVSKAGKLLQLASAFFGGFIIAFTRGWLLALVMLTSLPLIAVAGAVSAQFLTMVSSKKLTSYGDAGDIVEQTIGAIRTVVSFHGEKKAVAMYKKFIRKAYKTDILEGLTNGFGMGSVLSVLFCSYGLAFWYGGKLIVDKGYTGGKIITVLISVLIGASSLGNATPSFSAIAEGQSAAYRLFETIERKPEINSGDTSGMVLEDIMGDIELKDVHFHYPSRPDQLIIDGLSLQVASGTTIAIVGESGSGKSTVISLVERFYDPQAGEVLIDGINIRNIKLNWIREKIGLVSQEPVLFKTSIKDNIMYGKEDATLEEIKRASELANAANFIDKLPNGYDTLVGQRGAQLSGGQKQRIAIARAILKDPKILLLDEATSALDVESERIVQEALNRIMVERTTLVVAHRLSTVRNLDCITIVRQGKMVEQDWRLALIITCVIPLVGVQGYAQVKFLKGFSEDAKEMYEHASQVTTDAVFFALVLASIGVSQTSALASDATKARNSAISIFSILDRKSKIDSSSDDGMTLALVGESSSGKSTIIALLERFYDPDSGRISLDGVEIKSLKVSWLRDQMGLVGQEPVLFNDTIRANITYGKHAEVTEEEVMAVAKASNAHEFISGLPQGYDTVVGEKGIQLSGGQKQRVAIARAIIKDPKILLLDEATSALDVESERIVQDALDQVMVCRTTIVVAHRLFTIKGADMIAVLKEGKIVEKGSHEALMRMRIKDGAYASLVELHSKPE